MIEFGRIYVETLKGKDSDGRVLTIQIGRLVLQFSLTRERK